MDPKPFASLSAGLLARKGTARPAMRRPHMSGLPTPTLPVSVQEDDLGWNDMGGEHHHHHHAAHTVLPLTMMGVKAGGSDAQPDQPPAVVKQQESLEQSLSQAYSPEPQPAVEKADARTDKVEAPKPVRAKSTKGPKKKSAGTKARGAQARTSKAAFTLRLDPDRHLRLRLACVVGNNSAQHIVTQALDAFLDSQPQLEALARQVPQDGTGGKESN